MLDVETGKERASAVDRDMFAGVGAEPPLLFGENIFQDEVFGGLGDAVFLKFRLGVCAFLFALFLPLLNGHAVVAAVDIAGKFDMDASVCVDGAVAAQLVDQFAEHGHRTLDERVADHAEIDGRENGAAGLDGSVGGVGFGIAEIEGAERVVSDSVILCQP